LVTTLLNNVIQGARENALMPGIVVDGDLQGMRTRMGPIQFPMDALITARDIPAQGQPRSNGTVPATTVGPTPPTGVVATIASGAALTGTQWGAGTGTPFVATGSATTYYYAVASTDVNMNESTLAWSNVIPTSGASGIYATGAVTLSIAGPAAADATAFRIFRSGSKGFTGATGSPTAVRYIGSVAANGASTVLFTDLNTILPGGESIFLLDLRAEDAALDKRYVLPLTRVELFAASLYMPWAVCSICALRNKVPKFHAIIRNFVPDNPLWNPLGANT
jgi:hypothetical protein